jgi:hypothetical protein
MVAKTLPVARTTANAIKRGVFMAKLATIRPRARHRLIEAQMNAR